MSFPHFHEDRQEEASKQPEREKLEKEQQERSTRQLVWLFLGGTAVILAAGMILARVAEALAEQTGLGTSFIGGTLLAASTSLPELSTTIMAVRLGNYQMAPLLATTSSPSSPETAPATILRRLTRQSTCASPIDTKRNRFGVCSLDIELSGLANLTALPQSEMHPQNLHITDSMLSYELSLVRKKQGNSSPPNWHERNATGTTLAGPRTMSPSPLF